MLSKLFFLICAQLLIPVTHSSASFHREWKVFSGTLLILLSISNLNGQSRTIQPPVFCPAGLSQSSLNKCEPINTMLFELVLQQADRQTLFVMD